MSNNTKNNNKNKAGNTLTNAELNNLFGDVNTGANKANANKANANKANANKTNANKTNANTTTTNANKTNTNVNRTNTNTNKTNTNTNANITNTNTGSNITNTNTNANITNTNTNANITNTNTNINKTNTNTVNSNINNLLSQNKNNVKLNNLAVNNNNKNLAKNANFSNMTKSRMNTLKNATTGMMSTATNKMYNAVNTATDTIKDTYSNVTETVSEKLNNVGDVVEDKTGSSLVWTIIKIAFAVVVFIVLLYIAKYLYVQYELAYASSPYLLEGTKNAKHALVISQNPENTNYIPIKRSEDRDGIEFTYQFWLTVEDFSYKKGEWKHIMHKGNSSSYPNRAPGVWIHPDNNTIRVYMNTQNKILEYVDIENIPVRKWLHIAIVLRNKDLDVYVNGYLKVRKELSSLPRQNEGDFWVNMYGGFEGYVSRVRYYNYAVDFATIDNEIREGPSSSSCIDTGESPPYLDDNWWFS